MMSQPIRNTTCVAFVFASSLFIQADRVIAQEAATTTGELQRNQFVNPIGEGADPWVIRDPNAPRYLWCMSEGNRAIAIHTSDSPASMGRKHLVWKAPESGPVSRQVWAPELHYLDGRWYVYFAASDGENVNHLMYVLESKTADPLGEYELHGPLATGDGANGQSQNVWAIDMTVLQHKGRRYAIWSGWDKPGSDNQYLYIAPMQSPVKLAGPRIRICDNDDYLWERTEPDESKRGLAEAPQVFQNGERTSVVYSCGASWLPTYKLGLLELVGDDPLQPTSWKKHPEPVFKSTSSTYGVGHSCFVKSLDNEQWWHIFHAKQDRKPSWRRAVFAQPMSVSENGLPDFGEPINPGTVLTKPSGRTPANTAETFSADSFDYFGHHQYLVVNDSEIRLGRVPAAPINHYRCGEKVVFTGNVPPNFTAEVSIDFGGKSQARDAGILFRTTGASVGYDAQRGYFAGLIPKSQRVILGRMDGKNWSELARAVTEIDTHEPQRLSVEMHGDHIKVLHNGQPMIAHTDGSYQHGAVGLRVVDTDATFTQLQVKKGARKGPVTIAKTASNAIAGRWSKEKANEWYAQQAWPVGTNFVPSTAINQLEMWQADTFDPETIDRELGWASKIGMNAMRVYLHDLAWSQDPDGFLNRVDKYLSIADKHGIKTMFVFWDSVWNPNPKPGKQPEPRPRVHNSGWVQSPGRNILQDPTKHDSLKPYVTAVMEKFKNDKRVLAWDLFNEPENANNGKFGGDTEDAEMPEKEKIKRAIELLVKTIKWAREVKPDQPLTIGVWGAANWIDAPDELESMMLNNSDIITFHSYDGPDKTNRIIRGLLRYGRPMMCTEYLARGNRSTFESILPIFHKHKIGAINWGLVEGKTNTIYPWHSWNHKFEAEPDPWHHDVFRKDGTPYRKDEVELIDELTKRPVTASNDARPEGFVYDDAYNRGVVANGKFFKADKTKDRKLTTEDGQSWATYKHLDNNSDNVVDVGEFTAGIDLPLPDFGVKAIRNVVYKEADRRVLLMDIHQPATANDEPTPVLYYSHGGGWSGGRKEADGDILQVCNRLSNRGFTVVMVSYRMVREWDKDDTVTMRDCIVDCRDGLRFLKKHEQELNVDMDRVAVFGSSAGGHLAQLMTFSKPDAFAGKPELQSFSVIPATGVSWFGPSDFRDESLFAWDGPGKKFARDHWAKKITRGSSFDYDKESAEVQAVTDRLSPVWWLDDKSAPLLHVHGDQDSVIPPHHGKHLQDAAAKTGAPVKVQMVKGAAHGWWKKGTTPDRESIIEMTVEFILANTRKGPTNE